MNKLFKILTTSICVILLFLSISVSAAGERIITSDVTAKTDRLFEIKIGFDSDRTITAATFTLTYNPNDIVVRTPVCNFGRAKIKYNDTNGKTDIIFLCSSGISCKEFPTLFTMKYKKISDADTKVTIKASDCVDNKLKSFTPPKSAVCNVKADGKQGSQGRGDSGGSGDSGVIYDSNGNAEDDELVTSGQSGYAESEDGELKTFSGEDDPWYLKFIPIILLVIVAAFLAIILRQNVLLKKAQKQKEEDKENKDKE